MKPTSMIAIYLLIWSLSLFLVLPFGVKTWREDGGKRVAGQADGAPQTPQLARKMVLTTIVATILFGLFYANYEAGWVTMDDFLPGVRPPGR